MTESGSRVSLAALVIWRADRPGAAGTWSWPTIGRWIPR